MKNEIMCAAMASLLLGFGSFTFAQGNSSSEKSEKEFQRPVPHKPMELDVLEGKIKVSGKDSSKIVTLTTDSKDTHVLTVLSFPDFKKGDMPKMKAKPDSENEGAEACIADKDPVPDSDRREPEFDGKNKKEPPKILTMNDLIKLKGKTVQVKGIMNKETNIFTVFEIVK